MPFDHFNLIASLYNRSAKYNLPAGLLDLLALQQDFLLLDAGGGTGRVAESLRNLVQEVIIADPSQGMLRHAVHKGLKSACAPAEKLPFAANSFNRIILVDALHHVRNQKESVTELWRVLTSGGRLVIIEPDINKFPVKLIAVAEIILLMRSHFLSAAGISRLFADLDAHVRIVEDELSLWICAEKVRQM